MYHAIQKKYECKMTMIGHGAHLEKQMKILNRIVAWKPEGIEIIADARHAEEIIKEIEFR